MLPQTTTFGRYVLLRRIAVGGMAEIFRAMAYGAEGFEKLVAIKRMLSYLPNQPQFTKMFINEAKLAANLNHSNIVQIFDFGCIEDLLFLSMEYVHGKDIAELTFAMQKRKISPPPEMVCHVFSQVLNGLDYAHRKRDRRGRALNLIHRDMSSQNILISYDGEVKIADFGIAKSSFSDVQTKIGVLKGKYNYMSPEQTLGKKLDPRSDLFSLGICLYEMLTLTEMYSGNSELDVLRKARDATFRKPREINPDIPESLESILLKVLAKNPDERYENASQFRDELERFLEESRLRFTPADLANLMNDIFREEIEKEFQQMDDEGKWAAQLRPAALTAAQQEIAAAALAPKTPSAAPGSALGYNQRTTPMEAADLAGVDLLDPGRLLAEMENEATQVFQMDDESMPHATIRMPHPDPALLEPDPKPDDATQPLEDVAYQAVPTEHRGRVMPVELGMDAINTDQYPIYEPTRRMPQWLNNFLFFVLGIILGSASIAVFLTWFDHQPEPENKIASAPSAPRDARPIAPAAATAVSPARLPPLPSPKPWPRPEPVAPTLSLPPKRVETPRPIARELPALVPALDGEDKPEEKRPDRLEERPGADSDSASALDDDREPSRNADPEKIRPERKAKKRSAAAPSKKRDATADDPSGEEDESVLYIDGMKAPGLDSLHQPLRPGVHIMELRTPAGKLIKRWRVFAGPDGKPVSP